MATSKLYPGEIVIDDSTPESALAPPVNYGKGLELGRRTTPFGRMRGAGIFPPELLIPQSEWQARIEEMEQQKTRLSDLINQAGLPCKNQSNTNFCWINAPVHCLEIIRVIQNQPMVLLSPASGGAPLKNFRNEGGWGEEALKWLIDHGVCPTDKWPANAIDRRYYTEENKAIAREYRVTEWYELHPRNHGELISCLLRRMPVALGYNWWAHEVTGVDAIWRNGTAVIRIRNSWGMAWPNAGAMGYGILEGQKMYADDAVTPLAGTARAPLAP